MCEHTQRRMPLAMSPVNVREYTKTDVMCENTQRLMQLATSPVNVRQYTTTDVMCENTQRLMQLATSPFSDLHMTESSSGASHLKWCSQLLETPVVSRAGDLSARSTTSANAESVLRRARMRATNLCTEQIVRWVEKELVSFSACSQAV